MLLHYPWNLVFIGAAVAIRIVYGVWRRRRP